MGIRITGLDEFRRKLERLSRNAQNVNGPVAFDDLFPPEFMRRYTDFPTIQAMADASGFKIESQEDFEAIPDADWDAFVRSRTRFQTWQDMQAKAGEEYVVRRLNIENL
jgi:hypothetical protein